jgi:hypothetical protein
MSEELQAETVEDEAVDQQEQLEEVVEQPELSATEQKAWDQGWRPEENFEGNPDNWKTASEYVMYGEFQGQLRDEKNRSQRKEQEFEDSIANLNKLHDKRQEAAISALKVQQRQAVDEADTEAYDRLQTEIDGHEAVTEAAAPAKDPVIAAWEKENSWVNDKPNDEKTLQAQAFFNVAASQNKTNQQSLDYVDEQIAKLYPEQTNARRDMATQTEQPSKPATRSTRRTRELTMNDLTRDEAEEHKQFGSMFSSDKDFLKAVQDARKG